MILKVGNLDLTPYTAYGGIKWQRSDVDGKNAGRMLDGTMQRDRVAIKIRFDVTCRPLTAAEQAKILSAIEPEFVTLTYTDPVTNSTKSGQFYSNNFPSTFAMVRNGTEYWSGLTFPLIQK